MKKLCMLNINERKLQAYRIFDNRIIYYFLYSTVNDIKHIYVCKVLNDCMFNMTTPIYQEETNKETHTVHYFFCTLFNHFAQPLMKFLCGFRI